MAFRSTASLLMVQCALLKLTSGSVMAFSSSTCNAYYQSSQVTGYWENSVTSLTYTAYLEIELSFEVTSTKGWWTNLFRIGNDDNTRLPGAYLSENGKYMNVHQTLNSGWNPDSNNPSISLYPSSDTMVGSHEFYMAVSPTLITVIFDGVEQSWSGNFDRSNYIGTTQNVYFSDNSFDTSAGLFQSICVRTSSTGLSTATSTTSTTSTTASSSGILPSSIGFALSVGLQSNPLSASKIGSITSGGVLSEVRYYRFYGWDSDIDVAKAIVAASASPTNMKFIIEIVPSLVNSLTTSNVESLLSTWSDLKSNVYCIALGNEPLYNNIALSVLPEKLNLVYSVLQSQSGWENVKVSIPFSAEIFGSTYPVETSYFKADYKQYIASIIGIYKNYGSVFAIQLYPFFTAPSLPDLMQYILGEASSAGDYSSMLAAMYKATEYAMKDAYGGEHNVEIIITETGWSTSSSSDSFQSIATAYNANRFYFNTMRLMKDSSSELYGVKIFFFELFDEDLKSGVDVEKSFGVFDTSGSLKLDALNGASTFNVDGEEEQSKKGTRIGFIVFVICVLVFSLCGGVVCWCKFGRQKAAATITSADDMQSINGQQQRSGMKGSGYDMAEIEMDVDVEVDNTAGTTR
eukprot:CAMPEP_0197029060 /NCGR_PEP_ID=MMETSP1384-20130603/8599_1 /TAXON_ID=29189 /ORGANISM="Ammonia sp." /LENGTH=630 /DNA_ID=CAMNT_0042458163 /DNA_START=46 /DNA_END=1938 /DNA_ORIENTATION=+